MVDEYDVSFAVKEWLLKHRWDIAAFNPPGAQGTFTIPNPSKDPKYRGQTGSESPDIIAIKDGKYILMVEAKPVFVNSDVDKLKNLVNNKERVKLLIDILEKVCQANSILFDKSAKIIIAKAHGGQGSLLSDAQTFLVSTDNDWDPSRIDPTIDPYKRMKVILHTTDKTIEKIICE